MVVSSAPAGNVGVRFPPCPYKLKFRLPKPYKMLILNRIMEKIDIHNTQTSYDQTITKIKEDKKILDKNKKLIHLKNIQDLF